jgi:hypothetical protein
LYGGPTELYCNDSDGNNAWTYGFATGRYRDYDGSFREYDLNDSCLQEACSWMFAIPDMIAK